ncbi:hypothetical protein [Spirillospora sp. NPDC048819]|uniref:hypothetical protein n=1 Tax=Spirillospora sp. NPDC048819 TaxID=3155268 RepID=UPI00340DDA46
MYAAEARPDITDAAEGRSRDYRRSQVLDFDGLAVANFLMGEPGEAAAALDRALDLAVPVTSARAQHNLHRTIRLGRARYGGLPAVQELRDRVRTDLSHELE